MAPLIVFDADGEFLFTTGSPGGSAIIAYTAKTVVAMIDWGLSPQEAIELPNLIARNGSVRVEEELISEDILTGLESLGHNVIRSKGEISGLHIIYRQPDGTLIGGADPRREGAAKSL
jgi:gamma-glutamyltranspeptidase/glutathione hydrolase